MNETDLVVGRHYYMVTYPESEMVVPVILTYRYVGKDLDGTLDDLKPAYYFRYLPGTMNDAACTSADGDEPAPWIQELPELFSGWGEQHPTVFNEDGIRSLLTLEGLIGELMEIQRRVAGA